MSKNSIKRMLIAITAAVMASGCGLKNDFLNRDMDDWAKQFTKKIDSEYSDASETEATASTVPDTQLESVSITPDAKTDVTTNKEPEATQPDVPELRVLAVEPFTGDEITLENTQVDKYEDHIDTDADEIDKFFFVPPIDGRYRFQINGIQVDTDPGMRIFDSHGEMLEYCYTYGNGDGITLKGMNEGEEYRIEILGYGTSSGASDYVLSIFYQKPTIDISTCTYVNDSIEFIDQRNVYKFTPTTSGTYRFEIINKMANSKISLMVFDEYGERLEYIDAGNNGDGISVYLEKDKTYDVQARQASGTSSYTLNIGHKKPILDITEYDQLTDSIQFEDQRNSYHFTATEDCTYVFTVSEIKSGNSVHMVAYNRWDELIDEKYSCTNGDSISVEMKAGETYRILVRQYDGLPTYTLSWEKH